MGRQACRAGNTCNQARRACTAAKACMQTGPIGAGYKRREVLREESRMALSKGLCTRCQGSTARKDGEGHAVAGASVTPGVFTGDDEEAWRALQFKRTRWPHLLLLCPCMQQFDVGCDGGRVGNARTRCLWRAPHVPEMKAAVATVTLHRSFTRLETAKPRNAQSRCAPSVLVLSQSSSPPSAARPFARSFLFLSRRGVWSALSRRRQPGLH